MRMDDDIVEKWQRADEEVRKNLPPGVKLVRTLRGHTDYISLIAWSPNGRTLASSSADGTIRLWDAETGKSLRTIEGHKRGVWCIAFDPTGEVLASGDDDCVKLWETNSGNLLNILEMNTEGAVSLAFDPMGRTLASGTYDKTVKLWEATSGKLLHTLKGHSKSGGIIAFDPTGHILASGSPDGTVKLWEVASGKLLHTLKSQVGVVASLAFDPKGHTLAIGSETEISLWKVGVWKLSRVLEGHTGEVSSITFASNITLFASRSIRQREILLWRTDTFECVAKISFGESNHEWVSPNIVFHPHLPQFAAVIWDTSQPEGKPSVIQIYELNLPILLSQHLATMVSYTSAKIVLVGDSGVGKTGLGWRLAHGEFKEHSSTHGQQFWLLNQLCKQRRDGTQCEAVLWDLAGQPDYRLIHALFLDDADLALLLFDSTRNDDLLNGVEYWLKQLKVKAELPNRTPTVLIAARSDRGTPRLTKEELNVFCEQQGIKACLLTSAKSGEGIEDLIQQMQKMIPWDDKPATVTTETFKRIKDFVLGIKENKRRRKMILTPKELRKYLERTDRRWKFSDAEMLTAVGHLENHGYVKKLKTSKGEPRILLAPELLNNLAASFILEARRNQEGLGSLEEQRLLLGDYKFPELEKLTEAEQDILLDSVAVLFLEHNICFREINPLNNRAYLVFPELINMKKPMIGDDTHTEDGVAYTVGGTVENVYASLVVLMGYTQNFTRTNQWQNHARYEVGKSFVCGFRLEEERAGELDFVLYFGTNTPATVRTLFQSLFESFLARRNLTVRRYEPVVCSKGHILNRAVVRQKISSGAKFAFCSDCGMKIMLPKADQPIYLTKQQVKEVEANHRVADKRSRFEQALFRLKSYVTDQEIASPECFISYAWGNPKQEIWVENSLATDLQKAGITVVLDRWENSRIGASVPRFVERVGKADRVIVVGTPLYRKKYENNSPMRSFVVAAEGDLIGNRMIGTEAKKESVLPVLLKGPKESAFPVILQSRVYADFSKNGAYFDEMFKLLLSLYQIPLQHKVAVELRELLMGQKEL